MVNMQEACGTTKFMELQAFSTIHISLKLLMKDIGLFYLE